MKPLDATNGFGAWNYVVFAIVLAISASIGLYYRFTGGKQKTTQEYLLADGNMSIIPVAFSLMASFMSAISLLGASKEIYSFGMEYILINFGYLVGIPIAAYGFLPVFFKMKNTSVYEYLELRFGVFARLAASISFSIQMILYMGIVLYSPALTLSVVTGISQLGAVLSVGLVCTFYSTLGGMKAVLLTDVFQVIIMFAAIYSIFIKGTIDAGGFSNVWDIAKEGGRTELFDFNPDPTVRHTFWTLMIGGMFTCLSLYAVNQAQVQRSLTAVKNLKKSQNAMWLNWPIMTVAVLSISTAYTGLLIYARYYDCDPLQNGRIDSMDQILPLYVMDSMSRIPGLPGLFVAEIFSGALSTISSAVNSLAAVSMEDYLKPFLSHFKFSPLSNSKSNIITKCFALLYGLLCIGIAFMTEHLGGVLQAALTIFGVMGGPLLGLFTLGLFFWIANETGAVIGLLFGLAISFWIGFGGPKPPLPYLPVSTDGCNATESPLLAFKYETFSAESGSEDDDYFVMYRISYLYTVVIGFLLTVLVGLLVSVIKQKVSPEPESPINPDFFSPFVRRIIPAERIKTSRNESTASSIKEESVVEKY